MNKFCCRVVSVLFGLAVALDPLAAAEKLKAVATTADIGAIAAAVGGEYLDVVTVLPAAACPGHFECTPRMAATLAGAGLVLCHGWETWLPELSAHMKEGTVARPALKTAGNWMIPSIHERASREIVDLLCEADPMHADQYRRNLATYCRQVAELSREIGNVRPLFAGYTAVCADRQREFLELLGFTVVGTYGNPEDITIKELQRIMKQSRIRKIDIVVDNIQSGARAGEGIARDLHSFHAALSNFPLDGAYCSTVRNNVIVLKEALHAAGD